MADAAGEPAEPEALGHPTPRWLEWLGRVEILIGSLALITLFVMVLIQAAQRYTPWAGLPFTGELARFCLVWLSFSVLGVLLTRDEHITMRLIDMVPHRLVLTGIHVFALVVVAAVGIGGFVEGLNLMDTMSRLRSPAMQMPMSWLYAIPMAGFASLTVRAFVGMWLVVRYGPNTGHVVEPVTGQEVRFE